jgi:hypothetical protein
MSYGKSGTSATVPALNSDQKNLIQSGSADFAATIDPQNVYKNYADAMPGSTGSVTASDTAKNPTPNVAMNLNQTIDSTQFRQPQATDITAPDMNMQQAQAVFNPTPAGMNMPVPISQDNPAANDYAPMLAQMQKYVQSMQQLAEQMNQRFR